MQTDYQRQARAQENIVRESFPRNLLENKPRPESLEKQAVGLGVRWARAVAVCSMGRSPCGQREDDTGGLM